MSIYSTPLHFGYFLALLFAFLFIYRGWQEERLSDKLLGCVMFLLAMEIQDYTFGFSGINYLWEEMNGFPRHFSLAFAPTIYLYLNAQINREFKFGFADLRHFIPYAIYFLVNFVLFIQGEDIINLYQQSSLYYWITWIERFAIWASYFYYFSKSLNLYRSYRSWAENQFSDIETISFLWLRNFIYLIVAGEAFKWLWQFIDMAFDDLPFEQDWWWNLFTVFIIGYIGIKGYSQMQPKKIFFHQAEDNPVFDEEVKQMDKSNDYSIILPKINRLFQEERIYLRPDLSLQDLAIMLNTNTSFLSATINSTFEKNFNDFVNEFRVEAFKHKLAANENKNFTLLALAFDSGFNSKATFNRAVKKLTGLSPKELATKL